MELLAAIAALIGVLAAGIFYGTDAFCVLIQRPARAEPDDADMAAAVGRVHQHGDRRPPVPGVIGIGAAVLATVAWAVRRSSARVITAGKGRAALIARLGLRLRVAAPINRALTAAAIAHMTPGNARILQARWDSIIVPRALQTAAAVAGLASSAAALTKGGSDDKPCSARR